MTDFDALIDNVVESAKELENEHEHRGFYIDSIKKNHAFARSALREAIADVVKEADQTTRLMSAQDVITASKVAALEAELKTEAQETYRLMKELESAQADRNIAQASLDDVTEQLKEADADAERLWREDPFVEDHTGGDYCVYCGGRKHDDDCPHVLHVARLSKRGQGIEKGSNSVEEEKC